MTVCEFHARFGFDGIAALAGNQEIVPGSFRAAITLRFQMLNLDIRNRRDCAFAIRTILAKVGRQRLLCIAVFCILRLNGVLYGPSLRIGILNYVPQIFLVDGLISWRFLT